jgi:hypothetical protein
MNIDEIAFVVVFLPAKPDNLPHPFSFSFFLLQVAG